MRRSDPGIGATPELSLRVSVAALVRVLFEDPNTGEWMIALERKATLLSGKNKSVTDVKSQPFGGALRIHNNQPLHDLIGDFHFDSEESLSERDFRLFIRPSAWEALRDFCLGQFSNEKEPVIELDPTRELAEEFADTLGVGLNPDQYFSRVVGMVVEDHPSATEYIHASGYPTARIYRIFEARIPDLSLANTIMERSASCTDEELNELAVQDFRKGGLGRANTVLTLSFKEIQDFYSAIPPEVRNTPIWFRGHQIDETVAAVLDGISVPRYQRRS
jgi:hypothetical protein